MVFGSIFLNLIVGVIYDTHGRKIPIILFLTFTSLSLSSFPYLKSETEFYIAALFLITLPIVNTNPFVADLILKESHGIGNMLRSNAINFAHLSAYGLLMLNASYSEYFSSYFIYLCLSLMMLAVTVLAIFGMKDIFIDQCKCEGFTAK